jgi:aryl-alcohol dehydrogenase-like predicted oxidoreductase
MKQFEFSLTNRKADKSGLIDACKELGVIPLVRNPLDDGLASGKYTATNPSGGEAGGAAKFPFAKLEKLQPLHSVMETVAERASTRVRRELRDVQERMRRYGPAPKINTDITTAQVAINYVIAKGAVPLCDVVDTKQAEEVIGCLGWSLSDDEVDMLDSAAALCGL